MSILNQRDSIINDFKDALDTHKLPNVTFRMPDEDFNSLIVYLELHGHSDKHIMIQQFLENDIMLYPLVNQVRHIPFDRSARTLINELGDDSLKKEMLYVFKYLTDILNGNENPTKPSILGGIVSVDNYNEDVSGNQSIVVMTIGSYKKTQTYCPSCNKMNYNFVKISNQRRKCDYCVKWYNVVF